MHVQRTEALEQQDTGNVREGKVTVTLKWVKKSGSKVGFHQREVPQTATTAPLPEGYALSIRAFAACLSAAGSGAHALADTRHGC